MNIFFVDEQHCGLADSQSEILAKIKLELLTRDRVRETDDPDLADAIVIEEKGSFKNFRYISKLLEDPFISKYTDKIFTINSDDCATGLLRGLYTSLPKSRIDRLRHRAVPFINYPNELIFQRHTKEDPHFMASWRGNTMSNQIRRKMMPILSSNKEISLEITTSWLNHSLDEKKSYIDLILNAKFSLCPAGWAPVTYRIYESMALGRCPVILADEFVPPSGPDWSKFALFYPEKRIEGLSTFLHSHAFRYDYLGATAYRAWMEFFCPAVIRKYYADRLLQLINDAPKTTKKLELERWTSLKLYWSNQWTLPQRVINKAKKWSRVTETRAGLI